MNFKLNIDLEALMQTQMLYLGLLSSLIIYNINLLMMEMEFLIKLMLICIKVTALMNLKIYRLTLSIF